MYYTAISIHSNYDIPIREFFASMLRLGVNSVFITIDYCQEVALGELYTENQITKRIYSVSAGNDGL